MKLTSLLCLLSPKIYSHLITDDESIMISSWPEYSNGTLYPKEEKLMSFIMNAIRGVRNIRAEMNVPVSRKAKAFFVIRIRISSELIGDEKSTFNRLAGLSDVIAQNDKTGIPQDAVAVVVDGAEIFIPLGRAYRFEEGN